MALGYAIGLAVGLLILAVPYRRKLASRVLLWPLAGVARVKELCPQVMVGQTIGAGHFHQLVVPDQVNAMIDRFLAVAVPAPALAA